MSDKSLETLKVIIEAESKPLQDEMRNIRKELNAATKDIRELQDKIKKSMDKSMAPARKVKEQMDKIAEATRKAYNIPSPANKMKDMQKEVDNTEKKLKKLISTRNDMESTGGDIEYTKEYKELEKAVDAAEKRLNRLTESQERYLATGGKQRGTTWKRMQYDIEEADNSVKALKADMSNMSSAEKFQNASGYNKTCEEIQKTRSELRQLQMQQDDYIHGSSRIKRTSKVFEVLKNTLKSVGSVIKKTSGVFAALIQKFKTGIPHIGRANKSMKSLGHTGKGLGGMFQTLGMTARFMFASFAIMGTINGAKEGFKNLAQYSSETNKSISVLTSDLTTLKNAFATAFAPILNVVTPILDTLVTYLIDASNAIGQFFASLTGSTTWTKAVKVQKDYAGSLKSTASAAAEAKRELYGFDEITRQSDNSSAGGSSGGGSGIDGMFTTEEVSNNFANFAQMVKDAWKNADFTGIGEIVGTQIKEGLDGIDWTGIQASCNKVAKSLGTFINGFIGTEGLAESIGSTIGQAINTGVGTANTFFVTTDFIALGEFLAETANDALDTTDFDLLGETVANGLMTGINTWYGFVTTFDFSMLSEKISTSINSFFTEMEEVDTMTGLSGWQELGVALGKSASGLADTLVKAFEGIDWEEVKQGISELIKSMLDNLDVNVGKIVLTIAGFKLAKGALSAALKGLGAAIAGKIAGAFSGISFSAIGTALKGLGGKIAGLFSGISFDGIGTALSGLASKIGTFFSNALGKVFTVGSFAVILQNVIDSVGKVITGDDNYSIMPAFEDTWNAFKNFFVGDNETSVKSWFETWKDSNGFGSTSSKQAAVDVKVLSKTKASDVLKPIQLDANGNPIKTTTVNTTKGGTLQRQTQKEYTEAGFINTGISRTNTGYDLHGLTQSEFVKQLLHTGAKSDTGGGAIRGIIQAAFGISQLHTGAKSDTGGGSIFGVLQSVFGSMFLHTGAKTDNSGNDLRNGLQSSFGASNLSVGVSLIRDGWSTVSGWISAFWGAGTGKGTSYNRKANGGVFSGGSWHPVTAYAGGGSPASGQFFMAREAGPELVGTIGGHTAVMNNNQIVASVSSGVYQAMVSAMSQVMNSRSSTSTPTELNVYVGGEKVTDYVIKDINGRTLSTGKCPIVT